MTESGESTAAGTGEAATAGAADEPGEAATAGAADEPGEVATAGAADEPGEAADGTDGSAADAADEAAADTSHLDDLKGGCGCAEVWEHLSEKRGE